MSLLKPTPEEVHALAQAETQPALYPRFRPLALGPVLTVLALGLIGLVSVPWLLMRLVKRLMTRPAAKRRELHG